MKTFRVFYTNGQYYLTNANGTAKEFEAYLKQDGGRIAFEDSNGKEFYLWVDRVEEVLQCLSLKVVGDGAYRCDLEAYHGEDCHFVFSHKVKE